MADNKSIATRDSYGAALLELADAGHDDIVVFDADLSASTRTSVFAKKYSERFFDCGIAECNMVGVAARHVHLWLCAFCFLVCHVCCGPRF